MIFLFVFNESSTEQKKKGFRTNLIQFSFFPVKDNLKTSCFSFFLDDEYHRKFLLF